jgi:serine/threonine protein kinase
MERCRFCGTTNDDRLYCSSCQRPPGGDPNVWVGQDLGSHHVLRFLGEGPVGMVFQATHVPSGASVRLKVIDSELAETDPAVVGRASQLAVVSSGLHPALPRICEESLGTAGCRVLSVSWIDGQTLTELLEQGPIETTEACRIVLVVLDALDVLHTTGITYRDVKPSNVLVARRGPAPEVYLLDVGPSLISALSRSGAHYRSPEQARGEELIGPGTDIYGCGALLYRALGGRRPFESGDFDVLMSQISLRRAPALDQLRSDLPPALVQVVSRAMEPSPGDRYRSAAEMRQAVQDIAAQLEAAPPERRVPDVAVPIPLAAPATAPASPVVAAPPPAEVEPDLDEVPTTIHPSALRSSEPPRITPVEPEPASARSSGAGRAAMIAVTVIAVLIGIGMLLYTVLAGEDGETEAVEQVQTPGPTEPAKTPAVDEDTVRITLAGLPNGAEWFLNGRKLRANPFRVPRSALLQTVRVEARGYETFETQVSCAADQEVQVTMNRVGQDKAPWTFKAHTSGPGANVRHSSPDPEAPVKQQSAFGDQNAPAELRDPPRSSPR